MPTKHRRIAVIQDEQLKAAMERASGQVQARSDASLLRELALLGAETLEARSDVSPGLRRILAMPGVRPARGDWKQFLADNPPRPLPEGSDPYSVSKTLQEMREDRL